MPGLDPGIHVFAVGSKQDVDGRVKPGHDEEHASARFDAPSDPLLYSANDNNKPRGRKS